MRRIPSAAVLAGLVALSTLVRAWAGLRIPSPWIAADEMIYAELGRSLWETGRLEILGQDAQFYSLVHPALIGLPLALLDTALGYDAARVLQALAMSLTAVPVYLWGRTLMSPRWALAAAALTLTIPGLAYSGLLMTETVFYPALTLAAWAFARALVAPSRRAHALLLGAIALAVLTRLQGLVLVPVFVTSLLLFALYERRRGPLREALPALAALGAVGVAWLATGGLGAYGPAGRTRYDLADALRFVVYHAGDAVLVAGVVPACALALLALRPPAGRDARAFVAVAAALSLGLVVEVGVFASRYVGRLAERDLLGVAPTAFLALCLWLDRGAPRTRLRSALVAVAVAVPVLLLPLGRLVHKAALPDAFLLVPVWKLGDYQLVVFGFTAVAVVGFALLPRRALAFMPLALAILFAGVSVSASRFAEREATQLRNAFFGSDPGWVDARADDSVGYLYDGEPHWNAVWAHVFWNRRIREVYDLGRARVPGPLPQRQVDPAPDGRLGASAPYAVASTAFTLAGAPAASIDQQGLIQKGLVLWRVASPLRLSTVTTGVQGSGDIYGPARLVAYGCSGGSLALTLVAKGAPERVDITSGGTVFRVELAPEQVWSGSIPAARRGGRCVFDVVPSGLIGSTRFEFVPG